MNKGNPDNGKWGIKESYPVCMGSLNAILFIFIAILIVQATSIVLFGGELLIRTITTYGILIAVILCAKYLLKRKYGNLEDTNATTMNNAR